MLMKVWKFMFNTAQGVGKGVCAISDAMYT